MDKEIFQAPELNAADPPVDAPVEDPEEEGEEIEEGDETEEGDEISDQPTEKQEEVA